MRGRLDVDVLWAVARHRLTHIAFAFCVLGGWAVWANRAHAMPAPLIAGLVQGLISATITIALQRLITATYGATHSPLATIGAAACFSLVTISGIHWLSGTPEILATIILPWLVGVSYIILFTLGLHKGARA